MLIFRCPCESSLSTCASIPSTVNSLQFAWGIAESSTCKFQSFTDEIFPFSHQNATIRFDVQSFNCQTVDRRAVGGGVWKNKKLPKNSKMLPSRVAAWAIRNRKFVKFNGIASGLCRGQRTRYLSPTGTALWRRLFVEEAATREGRRNGVVGPEIQIFDKAPFLGKIISQVFE